MITLKGKSKQTKSFLDHSIYVLLLLLSLLLLSTVTSCQKEEVSLNECGTYATIRDLRGLDGCSFVLELDNGERLEPIIKNQWCGTTPVPPPAIGDLELLDGKRVTVAYKVLPEMGSICMVGKVVEVTCIKEVIEKD